MGISMKQAVSIQRCQAYDLPAVRDGLAQVLAGLGGWAPYIQKGDRVLLKANLVMRKHPNDAATTHPAVVQAIAESLIAYGASVVIGDSPGGPFTEGLLRSLYAATGMAQAATASGASLNFNTKSFTCENPLGQALPRLVMTDMLNDVDKVISVAKLKTHGMMAYTGAVKNMFGTIPGTVKAEYHLHHPSHSEFADALIDICLCAKPVLSFLDGITAMEGHGPTSGKPRPLHLLMAANDPFALDKTACAIIGLAETNVPILVQAQKRKLCGAGLSRVNFTGVPWQALAVTDFDVPETSSILTFRRLPTPIKWFISHNLQPSPVFAHDLCLGCGDCVESCPVGLIELRDKKPYAQLDTCIRCFCCQELCPHKAISVRRPFLLRAFSRSKRQR